MDPKQKEAWIMKHRCSADDAVRLLVSAKKQRVSEYDERLRKLRDFAEVLFIKQIDAQGELFEPERILSPDLRELLDAPTRGLT